MDKTELLRRYTRIGLTLPILLPLLLLGLAYLAQVSDAQWLIPRTDWLVMILAILIGSIFVGGIPYVIYFVYAWHFSKRPSFKQIYIFLVLTPFLFFVLQFVSLLVYDTYEILMHGHRYNLTSQLGKRAALSAFVFPIAYSYIALILIIFHIRVRTIAHPQQATGGCNDY